MKIGIDIDNTLCKTSYIAEQIYFEKYKKDFRLLSKKEQYMFCAEHEGQIFDNCPLEEDAIKIINDLYDDGNEIYFITARANKWVKNLEQRTIDYLIKHGIKYNEIYFGKDEKLELYITLGLDVMLDDDYSVYKEITDNGNKAVMYNGILNYGNDGIRVNNWKEFNNYIERIKHGK